MSELEPLSVLDNVLHLLTNSYTIYTQGVVSELEPLSVLGDNILQLLTNSVDGVETVLWPYLIEYIMRVC